MIGIWLLSAVTEASDGRAWRSAAACTAFRGRPGMVGFSLLCHVLKPLRKQISAGVDTRPRRGIRSQSLSQSPTPEVRERWHSLAKATDPISVIPITHTNKYIQALLI